MFYPLGLYGVAFSDHKPVSQILPFHLPRCTMSRCFQLSDAFVSGLPAYLPEHNQAYRSVEGDWYGDETFSKSSHTGRGLAQAHNPSAILTTGPAYARQWEYNFTPVQPAYIKQESSPELQKVTAQYAYAETSSSDLGYYDTNAAARTIPYTTPTPGYEVAPPISHDTAHWPTSYDLSSATGSSQPDHTDLENGIAPYEVSYEGFGHPEQQPILTDVGQLSFGSPSCVSSYGFGEMTVPHTSPLPEPNFYRDWTQRHSVRPHERSEKDNDLLRWKKEGLSYKEIKLKGHYAEAESTLRGRYRNLIKAKEKRVRKPTWKPKDMELLQQAVLSQASKPQPNKKKKISWKQVANYISTHGGSYQYGNATCKKRYEMIMRGCESDLWTDGSEGQDSSGSG